MYLFQVTHANELVVSEKLDKIILYLTTTNTNAYAKKGQGLQKFNDLLRIAFVGGISKRSKVEECYKVHIQMEEQKKSFKDGGWQAKKTVKKTDGKVISYWCFSPGFG